MVDIIALIISGLITFFLCFCEIGLTGIAVPWAIIISVITTIACMFIVSKMPKLY